MPVLSKNYFKTGGEKLIKEMIEFMLRPSGRAYTPKTGYFHDKTKISWETFSVNYLLLKLSQEAMYFVSLSWRQVTYKIYWRIFSSLAIRFNTTTPLLCLATALAKIDLI